VGVGVVGSGSCPVVWRSPRSLGCACRVQSDHGVAVPEGRCVGSLEVRAASVQLGPAEQALPPAEGPPEQ
jgi:hypothetical protein